MCIVVTAILDSFFLFYLPIKVMMTLKLAFAVALVQQTAKALAPLCEGCTSSMSRLRELILPKSN